MSSKIIVTVIIIELLGFSSPSDIVTARHEGSQYANLPDCVVPHLAELILGLICVWSGAKKKRRSTVRSMNETGQHVLDSPRRMWGR